MRRCLLLALLLAACAGGTAPPRNFVLRIAVEGGLAPLGPDTRTSASVFVQNLAFSEALIPAGGAVFRSRVFDRWELDSPRRARVHLDPAAHFIDGSRVTLADVEGALGRGGLTGSISGPWLTIEPAAGSAWTDVSVALARTPVYKEGAAGPVGVGPFVVVEQSASRIVLARRPPVAGRVNRVELIAFKDGRAAFAATLRGEANALFLLDEGQRELLGGIPRLRVLRAPAPSARAVFMNPALDPALRRAIAARLLAAKVGEIAYGSECTDAASAASPAELPPGRPLGVLAPEIEASSYRAALAVRRALGPRGGGVVRASVADVLARVRRGEFDLLVTPLLLEPPGSIGITFHTGAEGNYYGYSNPIFDAALDAGDYAKADEILREDPPMVVLCRGERLAAVDSRIENATLGAYGMLDTLPDWEVAPEEAGFAGRRAERESAEQTK